MNENEDHNLEEDHNRDLKKYEMVLASHRRNKESGAFQTINQIFSRLPLPRLQKNGYKFLFQNLKDNVEAILKQQDYVKSIQMEEKKKIDEIQVKMGKPFDLPDETLKSEVLPSNRPLFKSLIYLRDQSDLGLSKTEGDQEPFLTDSTLIQVDKIPYEIPNLKLFLEDQEPLRKQNLKFINENQIVFQNKTFPSSYDIDKRAELLAKLYLLEIYREESRKLATLDRQDEGQLQKKRQINKIKQDMEKQKLKQGELIEDMDLMKQVIRIMDLIEKKMNAWAYDEFRNKNGDKAHEIKKSLQKIKNTVNGQPMPKTKLKILIAYKHKKGW